MTPRIRTEDDLKALLLAIDGRGYKAYKQLTGSWQFGSYSLEFDHVQGDPFADPSRVTAFVRPETAAFDPAASRSRARALGTAAFLVHAFADEARQRARTRGSGKSGTIEIEHPGQVVLAQTAVRVHDDGAIEARFTVGLPARGRRIAGREAVELLLEDVPAVVRGSLLASAHDARRVEAHAAANEDAEALRAALHARGLIAFVADGSRLPRRSGIDDRPLDDDSVVPFSSPPALRIEIETPNRGSVTGMGVPEGVTLVVGGGFHGKSTLLRALQDGVYNHPPGDGRECAVARATTVKVRAEDGRPVAGVDISGFIDGLPKSRPTRTFTTANASGSTSQAAAIVEALEAGADVLLVDEDTAATNFMIRDRRMQELVPPEAEPITPFVDRVRELHRRHSVSTVLVLGGSGDYLDVADRVIRMDAYRADDVTERARVVAESFPTGRHPERSDPIPFPASRRPVADSIDPRRGRRSVYVRVPDARTLVFGRETIDLAAVEQLATRSQSRSIGLALAWIAENALADDPTVPDLLDRVERLVSERGLDALTDRRLGTLASFRRFELAAALGRLRSLRVTGDV